MKCFALWVNDNGSSMVAELSPEQGQDLIQQVESTPANSPEEAMTVLQDMVAGAGSSAEEDMMRGYSKGQEKSPMMKTGLSKVFGEDM
jgi:hypothetical protein